MCVSFCHRREVLYWNHENCDGDCPIVSERHGRCEACRHRRQALCGLTNTPLPAGGGCCHFDVAIVSGEQEVTREMVEPLGIDKSELEAFVLARFDVEYTVGSRGEVLVDPDLLPLPVEYGRGTDHQEDEVMDWSVWFEQWVPEEVEGVC